MQDGPAVAYEGDLEAVQQRGRVPGVAERDVELLAQPGGQEDVLVAVAAPACLVGEIGDEEEGGAAAFAAGQEHGGHGDLRGGRGGRITIPDGPARAPAGPGSDTERPGAPTPGQENEPGPTASLG